MKTYAVRPTPFQAARFSAVAQTQLQHDLFGLYQVDSAGFLFYIPIDTLKTNFPNLYKSCKAQIKDRERFTPTKNVPMRVAGSRFGIGEYQIREFKLKNKEALLEFIRLFKDIPMDDSIGPESTSIGGENTIKKLIRAKAGYFEHLADRLANLLTEDAVQKLR